jgi:hypothetical protein
MSAVQRLNEIEAQEKALADEKKKLLAETKKDDLETVKKLCKKHRFTATQLRGFLKVKGKDEPVKKTRKPRTPKAATN